MAPVATNDYILDEGTRVWVTDPLFLGSLKPVAGKIIGYVVNFPEYLKLTGETQETQYWVDFDHKQSWISSHQIVGFLTLVK